MQTLTQPSLLLKPFAEQGDKNTLPVTNTDQSEPQRADLTNGFPAITGLPSDQGGLPPERKDFNALGYLTTTYDWFYQCGGTFTFNSTISTAIGGYPLGARLWYTNPDGVSMIVRSTIQNNTNDFVSDPTKIGRPGENKPWEIENFMGIDSPFPLFAFTWADHEFNDVSWLRADTWSWQSGLTYISAYDFLEDEYTNGTQGSETVGSYTIQYTTGPSGIKIVSAANAGTVEDIFEESGVAWYYILDTTNTQFKLPRTKYGFTGLRDTVGKYVEAGLPNIEGTFPDYFGTNVEGTGAFYETSKTNGNRIGTGNVGIQCAGFDASRSNSIYGNSTTVQPPATQMYLYFYVGNTIRNETEVDVGEISEVLNDKWDSSNMQVVDSLPANPQTGVFYFSRS